MRRVLIVDGSAGLGKELVGAVQGAGFAAECLTDAGVALRRLAEDPADVILLDLPGLEALPSLDTIRRRAPAAPVIATSAHDSVELAVAAMKRGARDFLRKPFRIDDLEAALVAAARGGPDEVADLLPTRDPGMERLLAEARAAAASEVTVQIVGESGTGKERLARYVHAHSARRRGPLQVVSCAALPEALAESELFGQERGSFTGVAEARFGQVRAAQGGTLVLDDVAEASLQLQPKLLRVLQEREVHPVGAAAPTPVDVRVIATAQRDLAAEVALGRFREDLYYRLDVVVLRVPPLRERPQDVPYLAERLLARFAEAADAEPPRLGTAARAALSRHPFRGNVRELENLMRRAVVHFPGREVEPQRLLTLRSAPRSPLPAADGGLNLRALEQQAIRRGLAATGGNRTAAARALGISVRTLRNKIRLYGLA